jgi:hypothetical protein
MPKFAVIKNNVVENIILADSLEAAISVSEGFECVEYSNEPDNSPYIGLGYSDGVFEQPTTEESTND